MHPFTADDKFAEIDGTRLAPAVAEALHDKHCYGLFVPGYDVPEVAVYVKLMNIAPDASGNISSAKLPGSIGEMLASQVSPTEKPNTAIFYTITNAALNADGKLDANHPTVVVRGASGRAGGEELIRRVANHLSEQYGIRAFSTLSPVRVGKGEHARGFRQWLSSRMKSATLPSLLTPEETAQLRANIKASANESDYTVLKRAIVERRYAQPEQQQFLDQLMTDLLTYYIVHEKAGGEAKAEAAAPKKPAKSRLGWRKKVAPAEPQPEIIKPKNKVTEFHIGNGAELANVHWLPPEAATESDVSGSLGMMVNYRYYPELLNQRKDNFRERSIVRLSPELAERYYSRLAQLGEKLPKQDAGMASGSALELVVAERPATQLVMPKSSTHFAPRVLQARVSAANQERYGEEDAAIAR